MYKPVQRSQKSRYNQVRFPSTKLKPHLQTQVLARIHSGPRQRQRLPRLDHPQAHSPRERLIQHAPAHAHPPPAPHEVEALLELVFRAAWGPPSKLLEVASVSPAIVVDVPGRVELPIAGPLPPGGQGRVLELGLGLGVVAVRPVAGVSLRGRLRSQSSGQLPARHKVYRILNRIPR